MPKFGKEILKGTGLRDRISGMCAAISAEVTRKAQEAKAKAKKAEAAEKRDEE